MRFYDRFSTKFASEYTILANFLDSRYRGRRIKNQVEVGERLLLNYAKNLGMTELNYDEARQAQDETRLSQALITNELINSFKNFQQNAGLFGSPVYGYVEGRDDDVLKWWTPFCKFQGYETLAVIACRLLSVPASGASVERNFSTLAWFHTRRRNRLYNNKIDN